MSSEEPEQIALPLVWVGVEETPIFYCNQVLSQWDRDLESFIVSFGQSTPPALIGTEEQMREQVEQIAFVPVKAVARISLSRARMVDVRAALGANVDQLEQARRMMPGDPR